VTSAALLDGPIAPTLDAGLLAVGAEPPAAARGQVVVVLDRNARPIGLLVPEGGGWAHRERPLTASVQEPAIGVARRALSRSAGTRLDPVCACLPDGRFAGWWESSGSWGTAAARRTPRSCFPPDLTHGAQARSPTRRSDLHDVLGDA
jgi:hypothetical protein